MKKWFNFLAILTTSAFLACQGSIHDSDNAVSQAVSDALDEMLVEEDLCYFYLPINWEIDKESHDSYFFAMHANDASGLVLISLTDSGEVVEEEPWINNLMDATKEDVLLGDSVEYDQFDSWGQFEGVGISVRPEYLRDHVKTYKFFVSGQATRRFAVVEMLGHEAQKEAAIIETSFTLR